MYVLHVFLICLQKLCTHLFLNSDLVSGLFLYTANSISKLQECSSEWVFSYLQVPRQFFMPEAICKTNYFSEKSLVDPPHFYIFLFEDCL